MIFKFFDCCVVFFYLRLESGDKRDMKMFKIIYKRFYYFLRFKIGMFNVGIFVGDIFLFFFV